MQAIVGGALLRMVVPPDLQGTLNEIEIQDLPMDTIAVSSVVQAYVPYKSLQPKDSGVRVERLLYRIEKGQAVPLDASNIQVKVGDTVISVVTFYRKTSHDRPLDPSGMLVVQDPMPSLFRAVEAEKDALAQVSFSNDPRQEGNFETLQTLRFADRTERIVKAGWWSKTPLSVISVWTAAFRGHATLPAAVAFDMYADGLRGHSSAGEVSVQ
jgi:uncharacterized protein YfaS (alpha-2-macroglobulin family)